MPKVMSVTRITLATFHVIAVKHGAGYISVEQDNQGCYLTARDDKRGWEVRFPAYRQDEVPENTAIYIDLVAGRFRNLATTGDWERLRETAAPSLSQFMLELLSLTSDQLP